MALVISFVLDAAGKRVGPTAIAADLSGMLATDDRAALRGDGLVSRLPLKLAAFLQDPAGLDPTALGGVPANVVQLQGALVPPAGGGAAQASSYTTAAPWYALQFQLPLGSLGGLADAHAALGASLVLGWGPSTYTPGDDGAAVLLQLPQMSGGVLGFDLQGLITTTFGDANLMRVALPAGPVYVILFNNVAISVLGIRLPPQVITSFILFAGPADPTGSNLGWSLAATQVTQPSS
jgi:hypothetical protein